MRLQIRDIVGTDQGVGTCQGPGTDQGPTYILNVHATFSTLILITL